MLLETNTFCSAGGFLANGTFISTGGAESRGAWKAGRGHQSIRHFQPCSDDSCSWVEYPTGKMYSNRWYPTVEQLPEGDLIIIGGSIAGTKYNTKEKNVPSYEFWPPRTEEPIQLDLLLHTLPYNLQVSQAFRVGKCDINLYARIGTLLSSYCQTATCLYLLQPNPSSTTTTTTK